MRSTATGGKNGHPRRAATRHPGTTAIGVLRIAIFKTAETGNTEIKKMGTAEIGSGEAKTRRFETGSAIGKRSSNDKSTKDRFIRAPPSSIRKGIRARIGSKDIQEQGGSGARKGIPAREGRRIRALVVSKGIPARAASKAPRAIRMLAGHSLIDPSTQATAPRVQATAPRRVSLTAIPGRGGPDIFRIG